MNLSKSNRLLRPHRYATARVHDRRDEFARRWRDHQRATLNLPPLTQIETHERR